MGLDQDEMMRLLVSTKSPYELRKPRKDSNNVNPGAVVSGWETAAQNLDFSVQHRYGLISRTYSGILHVVSLAYANMRDHADHGELAKGDTLNMNYDLANGLVELSAFITSATSECARRRDFLGRLSSDGRSEEQHLDLINQMLDAFIKGSERQSGAAPFSRNEH